MGGSVSVCLTSRPVAGIPSRYRPRRQWEIMRESPSIMALLEQHRTIELARRGVCSNPVQSRLTHVQHTPGAATGHEPLTADRPRPSVFLVLARNCLCPGSRPREPEPATPPIHGATHRRLATSPPLD